MYDSYRNQSIFVKDWMELVRTSFVYLSYEVMGVCNILFILEKLSYKDMAGQNSKNNYFLSEANVFPLKI